MNDVAILMEKVPLFYFLTISILGLLIGSFLNVVIYRLPLMIDRAWKSAFVEFFPDSNIQLNNKRFNLFLPRSSCPQCGHFIHSLENIPVLSWLLQKGRCTHCDCKISVRYPIIELITALMSFVVAWLLPFGWPVLYALIFTWFLITLTFIDLDTMLLPDQLTLPLLWLGLLVNLSHSFVSLNDAVLGAVFGYLSLWSIYWVFKLITGKEGMGYGDFKLFAALGAWFGWQALPLIILLSSFLGASISLIIITLSKNKKSEPFPFGPYLAVIGWIYLIYGNELNQLYYMLVL